jgi:anthrone oxygenase-like protein
MQMALEFLATFCCAIFAGAAIYINAVEHPARMSCGVKGALAEWAPSYRRATVMQASLAVLGFGCALLAWLVGAELRFLVAGIVLVAVAPFTLLIIMPTNRRLMELSPERDLAEAALLLARWNRLHAVRSVLGTLALVMFLWRP